MPRRSRLMAPSRSSRSLTIWVEALLVLGGFFLGAQIHAAKLLALVLELFDARIGIVQRRQFLAVSHFGEFGKLIGRGVQFVGDAVLQFLDARGGGFR